jgi:hypothetical protein
MKQWVLRLVMVATPGLVGPSCSHLPANRPGEIQHVVLVWLRERGDAAQRQKIMDAAQSFRRIPGVHDLVVGECLPGNRPIIDSTYDVAISMRFADAAAMQRYIDHPDHRAAADTILKPLSREVRVYDFTLR